ncbi:MAG TPA: 3-hydroxyacyl-CoA dehydrogenase NAD-binding domain-containing protein [Geobacteraceae bacterium]|nr:3-hydroxyacyl-CoA dehydrogenase NAD-binding domain-containing protein [Geobacteraceae bacterium]
MAPDGEKYRHWRFEEDDERIVWLIFDRADKNVNALSREALEELARVLEEIARHRPKGLVVRSGKTNGFIAGADVTEFTELTDEGAALALIERGQAVFTQLERFPVPTVALISGFCLGGGLELALACRYRIAADTPETQLGLPEVKLGIHPGFGGTVRLTRLIGPVPALGLMLTGRSVAARKAAKLGLVDYAVPERHLENGTRTMIRHAPSPTGRGFLNYLTAMGFARPLVAWYLRRTVSRHARREHYPAPYALIDLWERFGGDPAAMLREEARSVARLITGATARNLVRVFLLQERLRALGKKGEAAFRPVHVVGGGTMGGDIAAWCALQGLRVTLQDIEPFRLATAVGRAAILFRKKLREPRLVQAALDRLIPDPAGDGVAKADVVIEAIFEDAAAKRDLYRSIEPRMRPDAILATNTSSIPLEELAGALIRPERLVGLHFFNPVAKMQLVEIVQGTATDQETLGRAAALVRAIRRLPLPVRSSPGFLVNRILMPYLMEAVAMETEGIPIAEIDRAAVAFGMPMGPILLADTVGLDICLSVARILAGPFGGEVPQRLVELVGAGRLGKKSGRGFYSFKNGRPVRPERPKGKTPEAGHVAERLMLRLLNEAVACRREGVTEDGDLLDAGVIFGTGFAPFRAGPLHHILSEGVMEVYGRLKACEVRYGSRFAPDDGWRDLLEDEKGTV